MNKAIIIILGIGILTAAIVFNLETNKANGQEALALEPKFLQLTVTEQNVKDYYITGKKLLRVDQREESNMILNGFGKECYKNDGKQYIITDNGDCFNNKLNNYLKEAK